MRSKLALDNALQTGSLAKAMAYNLVDAFSRAAFPGLIRCRKMSICRDSILEELAFMELGTAIEGNGLEPTSVPKDARNADVSYSFPGAS
jgi:hypothetical protein